MWTLCSRMRNLFIIGRPSGDRHDVDIYSLRPKAEQKAPALADRFIPYGSDSVQHLIHRQWRLRIPGLPIPATTSSSDLKHAFLSSSSLSSSKLYWSYQAQMHTDHGCDHWKTFAPEVADPHKCFVSRCANLSIRHIRLSAAVFILVSWLTI